jgi:UDP-hydrolysing UDP-N-acetyl-D-glucosamine 2-epimerase
MKNLIYVFTGSRADYGLLKNVVKAISAIDDYFVKIIASGSHLSQAHGNTIDIIKADNLAPIEAIDLKISGDAQLDICLAVAEGMKGYSDLFAKEKPLFVLVLGDRYELWPLCMAATIFNIPIVHLHGGETTFGAIDEVIRHSVSKMSHIHFCSHQFI